MDDLVFVTGILALDPATGDEAEGISFEGFLMIRRPTGREVEGILNEGTFEIVPSAKNDETVAGDSEFASDEENLPDTGSME